MGAEPFRFLGIACLLCALSAPSYALEPRSGVRLRALDKITGNATDLSARVGETLSYGRLKLTVRACYGAPPEDAPEAAAFLEVRAGAAARAKNDVRKGEQEASETTLFSGWMFASSPGLSALEHPTYDVWVISCSTS